MPNRLSLTMLLGLSLAMPRPDDRSALTASTGGQDDITRLAWMAGCWQQRTGTGVTDEQWMAPAGGAMVGMSRTVAGARLRAWEALRIVTENGQVVYIAQPTGGAPTAFAATTVDDTLAVFENPAHDFPQRIAYHRVSADSLVATISAQRDGRTRRMALPMRRVRCGL